jgi:putative transposase
MTTMCRVLEVSASGYYAWRNRPPSTQALSDALLGDRIEAIC